MSTSTPITRLALATALALGVTVTPVSAKIVCWWNKDEVRECGNAVPPEYAQQGVERKSETGITIEKTERARTAEELVKQRADARRAAEERAERERLAAQRARNDRVLLQTFTTEEDLKLTRDGKVAAINSRIKHSEQLVEKLKENVNELQQDAAALERGGKKVPPELAKQIQEAQSQIDKTRDEIDQREHERVLVQDKFESDLARYRELKGT